MGEMEEAGGQDEPGPPYQGRGTFPAESGLRPPLPH
jgi:hypothetical protein